MSDNGMRQTFSDAEIWQLQKDNAALRAQLAAVTKERDELKLTSMLGSAGVQEYMKLVADLKQQLNAAQAEVASWRRTAEKLEGEKQRLESRTVRLERALTVIQEQAIGSADKVVCLNRLDFVREHAKQALEDQ